MGFGWICCLIHIYIHINAIFTGGKVRWVSRGIQIWNIYLSVKLCLDLKFDLLRSLLFFWILFLRIYNHIFTWKNHVLRVELSTIITFRFAFLILLSFNVNITVKVFDLIILRTHILAFRRKIYILFLYLYLFELTWFSRCLWRKQTLATFWFSKLWIRGIFFSLCIRGLISAIAFTFIDRSNWGLFDDLWAICAPAWSRRILLGFNFKLFRIFLGSLYIETFKLGFNKVNTWIRWLIIKKLHTDLLS